MSIQNPDFDAELDGFPLSESSQTDGGGDVLERLASNYVAQVRHGQNPISDDVAAEHPELAGELAELLPVAAALEQWKTQKEAECLRENRPSEFSIEQLGDCEIVREIGRGGMGVVFEARQGAWKRRVAVKMLPWKFEEPLSHWKDRFQQEAKTIAQLRHRNIVPIYTFGEHEGYCYYVMQYVEGLSLDCVLAHVRQPDQMPLRSGVCASLAKRLKADHWPSIAKIGVQVALALEHAHQHNVLHNDIKPANLLVDAAGQILVTDFCANRVRAELEGDFGTETAEERSTGTYRFLAPERLASGSDSRSDVYSLGVTLYELLTRQPAFSGQNRSAMLDRIARADFLPPRKVRPEIPWELEAIVLKAMSLDPKNRYQSARELRVDFMRFLNNQPISIPRPSLVRRWLGWCGERISSKPARKKRGE